MSLTHLLLKLLSVLLLVGANGFFVGAEFALVSVRRPKLEVRAAAGSKAARSALRLLEEPTVFISAVQLGITLASLALGWLGEPTVEALLEPVVDHLTLTGVSSYAIAHGLAIAVSFILISYLHIVLGELMPKMVALERAESLALFTARPLELFARIFSAPIWVFNKTGGHLGRLLGLKSSLEHTAVYTEVELRQLIDVSRQSGHLRAGEQRMINRVFDFSDTLVREAMVPRTLTVAISEDSSFEQIARAFFRHGYSRLPVYRNTLDEVIGFIHIKDVMKYQLRRKAFRLERVIQQPLFVVDTARLNDALRQMQKAKTHFGFVVDEHGGLEGIITLEDLLEEIVGEISDEHDEEVTEQIKGEADGEFLLDGGVAVRDLNRRLHLELPESENYTTLAGFLMAEAAHVLRAGEVVRFSGHEFKIEEVERFRIKSVRLKKAAEEPQGVEPNVLGENGNSSAKL